MKTRHAAQCLGFLAAVLLLTSNVGAGEPFAVEVVDATWDIPRGDPTDRLPSRRAEAQGGGRSARGDALPRDRQARRLPSS